MGMFDSLYIECPKCKEELEFQSKSGPCAMFSFKKSNLPMEVAIGINNDIVRCQFCNCRIKIECQIPKRVKTKLIITKRRKFDYNGNYNPKHPDSIKEMKKLEAHFNKVEKLG